VLVRVVARLKGHNRSEVDLELADMAPGQQKAHVEICMVIPN
jgi:hypothetical protein